jgi:PhoH-like ATPase
LNSPTRPKRRVGPSKLFVLDTNVLMHDPMSLFRFEEHDVFLPMIVLEELDGHKKGMTEVARNARQASRSLDTLASAQGSDLGKGSPLNATGHTDAMGQLFFQTQALDLSLPLALPQGKADNQILGVVKALGQLHAPRDVVLVSKDINMRVKARALGLQAEDYQNDKTLEDGDLLYPGSMALPPDFWIKNGKTVESWQQGTHTFYRISGPIVPSLFMNQFVYFEAPGEPSLYARNPWQDSCAAHAQGLQPPKKCGLGRHHAQPRTKLCDELVDRSGRRLCDAGGHCGHWQNPDGPGRRPDTGAR